MYVLHMFMYGYVTSIFRKKMQREVTSNIKKNSLIVFHYGNQKRVKKITDQRKEKKKIHELSAVRYDEYLRSFFDY